jgi:iron complex outermembrane recepter protein
MTTSTRFVRNRLSLSASVAAVALIATPALAQAPADDAGEIVVTGIRGSLASSARQKRATPTIVESITAEDIGKLPDVSIADSLARLPGVTAQRLEGRDQRLSIRGLGPDFSTTLLNGREQVTVGDNRGVEYDQYPSEFFNNVVVQKSPDASLIAAGIAGTVDLRMLRPLAQKDRIIAVQARGQMNGLKNLNPDSPRYGYRGSVAYVDKFADDTLGIALGVSVSSSPSQNERYAAWGFPVGDVDDGPDADTARDCLVPNADGSCNRILGGAKPYVQSNLFDRYGAVATIEYEPSDNFHSTLDVLYSKFKETQRLRGIEFPINPGWGSGATIQPGFTASNGLVNTATITGVQAVQRNDINKRDADTLSIGWNNVIGLGGSKHLKIDAAWSRSTRTDFLLETYTGAGYNGAGPKDTIKISRNGDGTYDIVPTLNYTDTTIFGITDPRGWGYNGTAAVVQAGFLNRPNFTDDLKALRASLDGEFGGSSVFKGWEIGANYSRRTKVSKFTSFFLCPKGAGTGCTVASGTPTFVPVPAAAKLGTNVSLDYLGVPAMLTLDPLYLYNNTLNPVFDNRPVSLVRDNSINEDVITGYAMLKIDGTLGGKALAGSIGTQVVHTKQNSDGSISNFSNGTVQVYPATGKASYTYVLPSAALSLELLDNMFVKMGASQSMVRARLDQLRINQEYGIDLTRLGSVIPGQSIFSSNGGNIGLRPYLSTNVDLSIEKYFANSGYISIAGYFKKLSNFVDPRDNYLFDFSAAVAGLTPAQRATVGTTIGTVSAPSNRGKGDLLGVEATLSLPFSNLSESLDGFGFFGSASYTDSTIKLGSNPTEAITIPGLSDWVANASLYFEKNGFQIRGSYRYRAAFLAEIAGLSANPEFRTARSEAIVDAQVGYEFQNGPMKGLSVMLQGKNLTDRPFTTFEEGDPRRVREYQRYGRDYYLAVSYKF